jgi:exonuclease III
MFSHRGVAILVKKCANLTIVDTKTDHTGNILALKVKGIYTGNIETAVISIYGPNHNNREFFSDLDRILGEFNCNSIIVGGDWNATWDSSPPENNLDVIHMQNIPSRERSEHVKRIADKYNLTDPYRFLNPNKREYTYIPNAVNNRNRSRLDYFLINQTMLPDINGTNIEVGRLTKLFDHRCITLNTGKTRAPIDRNKISDNIIDNPAVELLVKLTVKETYLNNADPESLPRYTINTLRAEIGRVHIRLKRAADIELDMLKNNTVTDLKIHEITELLSEAGDIAETLPDINYFEDIVLRVEPDIFFEGLIFSVKNEVLSKQSAIYKIKHFRKKCLAARIEALKKDFVLNAEEIFRQELILDGIIEEDLRMEISKYKKFERLNNEKITPHFMSLVKNDIRIDTSLSNICDDTGSEFETDTDRNEYMHNFYQTLYKKNTGNNDNLAPDCVEKFLGTCVNHPAILNAKLTDAESQDLDRGLDINELDTAIAESKSSSAPGLDGISNKFIRKYWSLFRIPLFKYTNFCLDTGTLTESFRTAKIRLIPKKGDPKKISNWRPISLLNCFYKIISRVITNRIKKVSDKITLVGQKGYSKTKVCQEVLLEITDKIFELRYAKKKGCILSLDIKKAFDSISHEFIRHTLKFFNFGENLIKWIFTICTGRKACLILDNGGTGKSFNLERGNAQGDVISPFLFNICYQILILKIECDLQIKKLDLPVEVEVPDQVLGAVSTVSHRAKKAFAFADDCNIITVPEKDNLAYIISILNEFGAISGLECNLEKTKLLLIGADPDNNTLRELNQLGVSLTDKLIILGFTVDNSVDIIVTNSEACVEKVEKQFRIWTRFNLSLPGRLNICKTMFYSQINYIGSTFPVPEAHIDRIESVIHRYVGGNLRISKDRVFSPVTSGGLGLFPVKAYLDAQKCSWIRRCKIIDQDWKAGLLNCGAGNLLKISEKECNKEKTPVRYGIASAFSNFIMNFTRTDLNFKKAFIFDNEALTNGIRAKTNLTRADLTPEHLQPYNEINIKKMLNLNMTDILLNDAPVTKPIFQRNLSVQVSPTLWDNLDKTRRTAITRYGKNLSEKSVSLAEFFLTWKKGSKKVRLYLEKKKNLEIPHNIVKFSSNTEIIVGYEQSKTLNAEWDKGYLSNDLRTFIFKLHNNTLPVNTILSHFVREVSRNCTFCDLTFVAEEEDETVLHLFYNCHISETLRENFFKWLTDNNNFTVTRREFFGTFRNHNNHCNEILKISVYIFMKFIWDCKVRKCLPNFNLLKCYATKEFYIMKSVSTQFQIKLNGCGFNVLQEAVNNIQF